MRKACTRSDPVGRTAEDRLAGGWLKNQTNTVLTLAALKLKLGKTKTNVAEALSQCQSSMCGNCTHNYNQPSVLSWTLGT